MKKGIGNILIILEVLILIVVLIMGIICQLRPESSGQKEFPKEEENLFEDTEDTSTEQTGEIEQPAETAELNQFAPEIVTEVENMPVEHKVAQLFITSPESLTQNDKVTIAGDGTKAALENYSVTGLVYSAENYQGKEQFGALVAGAQKFNQEVNGNYLVLTARKAMDENNTAFFISDIYDTAAILNLLNTSADNIDTTNLISPVSYPENEESINGDCTFVTLQNSTGDGEELPYSLSAAAVNKIRNEYQYSGIIITDDLSASEISNNYPDGQAAVEAVKAGADIIYQTDNFTVAYQAVLDAVNNGEISIDRINGAVCRILTWKNGLPLPTEGDITGETDEAGEAENEGAEQTQKNTNKKVVHNQEESNQAAKAEETTTPAEPAAEPPAEPPAETPAETTQPEQTGTPVENTDNGTGDTASQQAENEGM